MLCLPCAHPLLRSPEQILMNHAHHAHHGHGDEDDHLCPGISGSLSLRCHSPLKVLRHSNILHLLTMIIIILILKLKVLANADLNSLNENPPRSGRAVEPLLHFRGNCFPLGEDVSQIARAQHISKKESWVVFVIFCCFSENSGSFGFDCDLYSWVLLELYFDSVFGTDLTW